MRIRSALILCLAVRLSVAAHGAGQASQPLQITNGPKVEHTDSATAVIAWSTNASAGTVVKYGTDPNQLNQTAQVPWGGLTHRVTVQNLQPDTTYYFQAISTEGQGTGTSATSTLTQFRTAEGSGGISNSQKTTRENQVIVGPIPQQITADSAEIYWQTAHPAENVIRYGTAENALEQTSKSDGDTQNHKVQLLNLSPDTTYYFEVQASNGETRGKGQFKTERALTRSGNEALRITGGPRVDYLASTQAKISWSTNVPSSSVVKYGTDPNFLNLIAHSPWSATSHQITLANLNPNTRYFFQVQSAQVEDGGSNASSSAYSFQTAQTGQVAENMLSSRETKF